MEDAIPRSPNLACLYLPPMPLQPSQSPPPPDPLESTSRSGRFIPLRRPPLRFTTEFDSEGPLFLHKLSCKFFDGLAKLKFSFQNDTKGGIFFPQLGFITKNLSLLYDVESRNALIKGSLDLGKNLQLRTTYDIQPRVALQFPFGEVALELRENVKENDEVMKVLSVDGIVKRQMLNGLCTAMYNGNDLNLRYSYKDKDLSFIPSFHLPSNALSFAFKRRFSPSDKLSYWYHFDSSAWSAVYKHTIGNDFKFKAGYDSEVHLGWVSLWVGPEDGKAKAAPMKMKVQMMLQVPQGDIKSSALMFRVKKRWDF